MKLFRVPLAMSVALLLFIGVSALAVTQTEPVDRPAPTVTLYATPAEISAGGTAVLTWTSKNSNSCYGSGAWSGSKARNGSRKISPTETSTYELSCRGRGGSTTVSVTVQVVTLPPVLPTTTTTATTESTSLTGTEATVDTVVSEPPQTLTPVVEPIVQEPTPEPTPEPPDPIPEPPVITPTQTICTGFTVPVCSAGSYPTVGSVDANGCIGASRCTAAVTQSTIQLLTVPTAKKYPLGAEFAGTAFSTGNAGVVYAPATGSASLQYSGFQLDDRKVWRLSGRIGLSPVVQTTSTTTTPTPRPPTGGGGRGGGAIQGATYGGSVKVTVTAAATKIDPSDKDSEVLYSGTLTPQTGPVTLNLPLGVWGMRPNLVISVTAEKATKDLLTYGVVADSFGLSSFGERPDQGIVNNDPMWESVDAQNKAIAALALFPVTWIHDSIRTEGSSWPQAPLLKREQDQGKKIQLVVGPLDPDYTEGAAARVPNSSEWGYALPLSKINLDLYEKRLRANLTSYKNAGVDVKAVEVGNELDLVAFNGDIPQNRAPTDADYQLFATSYAKFLERTVSVVKRPEFYPNAKIILGSPAIDWSPALGKLDPAKMYAPLKNLNGKNYFARVDGVGVHYYPADHEDGTASVARTKAYLAALGVSDRPVWVSEWGFYNNRFPNSAGKDRYRAFVDLYDKILRADFKVVFMTNFALDEFTFPFHLVDQSYQKLPEARFFDHYKSPVPSGIVADADYSSEATACTNCSVMDWVDETVALIRDFILTLLGN